MKVLIKFLILIGVIGMAMLAEDFIARGVGIGVCIATIIIGYMIGDYTETRETYGVFLFSSGYILALTFYLLTMLVQVHVDDSGHSIKIYSRFMTHVIAEGKKLQKENLSYGYSTEYGFIKGVEKANFNFLYTDKNTCIITSLYAVMMEVELPFTVTEKDFGDGYIQLIIDKSGTIYDLHGDPVNEDYHPIKVDHTIPDPCP